MEFTVKTLAPKQTTLRQLRNASFSPVVVKVENIPSLLSFKALTRAGIRISLYETQPKIILL